MISYWAPAAGSFTFREYREARGAPISARIRVRECESLNPRAELDASAHVFAALDQLGPAASALLAELQDRLGPAAPGWIRLNDPRRFLRRRPFLEAMAAAGLNDFRVFPATGIPAQLRYPVFLREADQHNGPLTGLLESRRAVDAALRALRWRGYRRADLLAVEYLSTADAEGRFRKYSAYRVGNAIVRTHVMTSQHWAVKSGVNETTLESARQGAAYLNGAEHEDWLRKAFEIARIDYGRIDYGVLDGRPQAWEINTNPTIGRRPGHPSEPVDPEVAEIRDAARAAAHERLRAAFLALDASPDAEPVAIDLPAPLLVAVDREVRRSRRRTRLVQGLQQAFHAPVVGWPVRFFYRNLLRRGYRNAVFPVFPDQCGVPR